MNNQQAIPQESNDPITLAHSWVEKAPWGSAQGFTNRLSSTLGGLSRKKDNIFTFFAGAALGLVGLGVPFALTRRQYYPGDVYYILSHWPVLVVTLLVVPLVIARVALWGRSKLVSETVLGRVALWRMRSRTRTHLSSLSDPMLKDIGLSRSDANREARKRFWEV